MNILSIETSCDETAVAILTCDGGLENPEFDVLGNALYSQIKEHEEYGGVYPNIAKREHSKNLVPLLKEALEEANVSDTTPKISNKQWQQAESMLERYPKMHKELQSLLEDKPIPNIDAIAVTHGPGLEPALWVGLNFAKALSTLWDLPLVPVNHLEAHLLTPLIKRSSLPFPALGVIVSGGHTELVLAEDYFAYDQLGQTQDDALGEAFDKVARMLDLGYPGGPEISRLAAQSRDNAITPSEHKNIELPRPMINSGDFHFSFSGLKTAALYMIEDIQKEQNNADLDTETKAAIAKEFEDAVTEVLIAKTKKALEEYTPESIILGGGVIANQHIRSSFESLLEDWPEVELILPPIDLTTDNAVMIGITGYLRYTNNNYLSNMKDKKQLAASGRLGL